MQQHPLDFIVRIGPTEQGGGGATAASAHNTEPDRPGVNADDARSIGVPFATPTEVTAENASDPSDGSVPAAETALP